MVYPKPGFLSKMADKSGELRKLYRAHISNQDEDLRQKINRTTQGFGSELFGGIFRDEVLSLFNRTVGGAVNGQINIRLMLGSPELSTIYWEVMRFRNEYIAFRHNLVRHPFLPRPIGIPKDQSKKLNVLVVSVVEERDPYFAFISETHHDICSLFQGFENQIKLTSLESSEATLDNIKDAIFEGVDIFHFTGHGHFNQSHPNDSFLRVSNRERLSIRFLSTLSLQGGLGFSFLNACETGRVAVSGDSETSGEADRTDTNKEMVGIAHSLMAIGVPIVVATNHDISVRAGVNMSKRFYSSVIKHQKRIDQAVRDARAELFIDENESILSTDWACPALYIRSRYFGLGTEILTWDPAPTIYAVRNVVPLAVP
jgi:hypothetical protein